MNVQDWTCAETAGHMEAYRFGQLDPSLAQWLFDHALECDRCYHEHWQPFQEEAGFLRGLFLESLVTEERKRDDSGDTIDGDPFVLTWTGWTSREDLPAPLTAVGSDVQSIAAPARAMSPISGPHLRQIGTLLPRVPKRQLLAGYRLYLGDGPPRPEETPRTAACLIVEANGDEDRVYLEALRDDVAVDDIVLARFERRALERCHLIELSGSSVVYQALSHSRTKRIGTGLLRHSGISWEVSSETLVIGRGEEVGLRLPNRQVSSNLHFRPEALQAIEDPIERSHEAGLVLDAVEVSRRHAVLSRVHDGGLELRAESRHPVYVHRDGGWTATLQDAPPSRSAMGTKC
jgi:hypothetical protein